VSPLWFVAVYLVLVWALCHQLGYFYRRLADGPRTIPWCLVCGGLFGLVGLVLTNIYPPSMVGVPGDRISNMGPPTHPSLAWRAQRPIWLVVPLVCTIPVILLFGRQWSRRPVPRPAPPAAAPAPAPAKPQPSAGTKGRW
jgi:hypothetical protein